MVGVTGTGCLSSTNLPGGESEADLSGKEFGFGSPGFDRIEWHNLNDLAIYWDPDHNMDGWGLRHAFKDGIDHDLIHCKAPQFSGPIRYPLIDKIKSGGTVYPTREFKLVAYDGEFTDCRQRSKFTFLEAEKGSVSFTIPESIAPRAKFQDLPTFTRETLAA